MKNLFNVLEDMFPHIAAEAKTWTIENKNSIKLKMKNGAELYYSYINTDMWKLETKKNYIRRMKKGE